MASKCIDNCVNIESDVHSLPKVTIYTNLHKWPMAEVEFVKSISHGNSQHRTMVMNNITCRQMYLRSYTFTRKENEEEGGRGGSKTGDQLNRGEKKKSAETTKRGRRKKSKATPCRAFVLSLVWKCFSCTSSTKVNKDPWSKVMVWDFWELIKQNKFCKFVIFFLSTQVCNWWLLFSSVCLKQWFKNKWLNRVCLCMNWRKK